MQHLSLLQNAYPTIVKTHVVLFLSVSAKTSQIMTQNDNIKISSSKVTKVGLVKQHQLGDKSSIKGKGLRMCPQSIIPQ